MAVERDFDYRPLQPRSTTATPIWTPTDRLQEAPPEEDRLFNVDMVGLWRTISKRRWLILAALVAGLAAALAITLLATPLYSAQSTLQIDREAARVVNNEDETPQDQLVTGAEFFQTQYGLLRSRALAARVADALGLARDDRFLREMGEDAPAAPPQRRERVIEVLQDNLTVSPVQSSRLVNVSFTSPGPGLSARVANAFAENFITSNLDRRFEATSYARRFLEERIAQTRERLEQSERQLVAYAQQQGIVQLNATGGVQAPGTERSLQGATLEALNNSLAQARADRILAEQQWTQARAAGGLNAPQVLASPTIQAISQERARLRADYQQRLQTYLPDYPDMVQLRAQIAETERQLNATAASIRNSLRTNYLTALQNERQLQAQVQGLQGQVQDLRGRSIQYNILQREVDTNRTLYDGLLQRYREVGVIGGVTTNNISIVDRAVAPTEPSSPKPLFNLALDGLSGLMLGLLIAFGLEALDQVVRLPSDVEDRLRLPVLGSVPLLPRGMSPVEALKDNRSSLSEAYHSLRSALQFSTEDGFPRSLLVTSTRPGEGKSTTALAVAQNIARLGFRVLLVDADLRNPSLHKTLGLDNRKGLSNLLTGSGVMAEMLQDGGSPNLSVIPCGPLPPNPAELLASTRLSAFLDEASTRFDIVIFDGPPVMGLADAPLIGSVAQGVLLMIEAGKTGRAQAQASIKRLMMGRSHILGAALTKFDAKSASYGYGYAYEYDYDYGRGAKRAKGGAARSLKSLQDRARDLIGSR